MVKVILWKAEVPSNIVSFTEKISTSEWKVYCKRMVKINEARGKSKMQDILKDTWEKINKNGGFKDLST